MFRPRITTTLTKNVKDFPFDTLQQKATDAIADAKENGSDATAAARQVLEDVAKEWALPTKADWMIPQLQADIAKTPLHRNENGLISGKRLAQEYFLVSDRTRGIFRYLTPATRGIIVPTQTKKPYSMYCSLVPLILAAFKTYKDIPYMEWDPEELRYVVDPKLREAMITKAPEFSTEELLELREVGLTYRSGTKLGSVKNPVSTYKPNKTDAVQFDTLPELSRIMLVQIWCAHPSVRNKYMVLDPANWDATPEALIVADVLSSKQPARTGEPNPDLPWETM